MGSEARAAPTNFKGSRLEPGPGQRTRESAETTVRIHFHSFDQSSAVKHRPYFTLEKRYVAEFYLLMFQRACRSGPDLHHGI
jgi:hypothetical protein